jgi:hypothetical protein
VRFSIASVCRILSGLTLLWHLHTVEGASRWLNGKLASKYSKPPMVGMRSGTCFGHSYIDSLFGLCVEASKWGAVNMSYDSFRYLAGEVSILASGHYVDTSGAAQFHWLPGTSLLLAGGRERNTFTSPVQ